MKKSLLAILLILSIGCSQDSEEEKNKSQFKTSMTEDEVKNLTLEQINYLFSFYAEKGLEDKFFEDYKASLFTIRHKIGILLKKGQIEKSLNLLNSLSEKNAYMAYVKALFYLDPSDTIFHEKDEYLSYQYVKKAEKLGGFKSLKSLKVFFEIESPLFIRDEKRQKQRIKIMEQEAEKGVLRSLTSLLFYRQKGYLRYFTKDKSPKSIPYKDDKKLIDTCVKIIKLSVSGSQNCVVILNSFKQKGEYTAIIDEKVKEIELLSQKEIEKKSIFSAGHIEKLASLALLKGKKGLSDIDLYVNSVKYKVPHLLNAFKNHNYNQAFKKAYNILNPDPASKELIQEYRQEMKAEMTELFKQFEEQASKIKPENSSYGYYHGAMFDIYNSNYLPLTDRNKKLLHHSYEWFKAEILSEKKTPPPSPQFGNKHIGSEPIISLRIMLGSQFLSKEEKRENYKKMYDFFKDQLAKTKDPYLLSQLIFSETELLANQLVFYDILNPAEKKQEINRKITEVYRKSYFKQKGARDYLRLDPLVYPQYLEFLEKKASSEKDPYLKGKVFFKLGINELQRFIFSAKDFDLGPSYNHIETAIEYGYVMVYYELTSLVQTTLQILQRYKDPVKKKKIVELLKKVDELIEKSYKRNQELGVESFSEGI